MLRLILVILLLFFSLSRFCFAAPYYGVQFSYAAVTKEPPSLHGYQLFVNYDPQKFKWKQFNVYFDAGISHFWVNNTPYYTTLNIYSLAPVVRYTLQKHGLMHPYFEFSIGLSYLNHTRLDSRNLGIHFAFQDRVGVGALFGAGENVSLGVHAVHYSNARLSAHNSGITVPLVLDVGYRF